MTLAVARHVNRARDKTYYDAGVKFGFIPSEGGLLFPDTLREAVLAEELGFDSVWLEEHHGIEGHYWPSPILALAAIATRTSTIRLGTDVIVASFYEPVRLAEDIAVLQGISGGRFTLGVGIGYRPSEFELYAAPLEGRGGRFEELIAILRALWRGERVDHDGRLTVHGSIEPRPVKPPAIWIGGWGPKTIERAARLADAWVPGPTADLDRLLALRADYDRALAAAGRPLDDVPRPLTRDLVIAGTDAEAWRLAEAHLLAAYRDEYGTWRHPIIGGGDAAPVDSLQDLARDRFIIGSPETCIAQIQRFRERLGIDQLILRLSFPGMPSEQILNELRLLAAHVLPGFA
jgi:alkanesulfonate monooxygenase SsuD/methylene tetrahydromethanopterin reductase-like flavin-dependent oxidoreductase (luciferase family)